MFDSNFSKWFVQLVMDQQDVLRLDAKFTRWKERQTIQ